MSGTTPSSTTDGAAGVETGGRRDGEDRLAALTRAYRSLAEMNEAIVRATDDLDLFSETCRVAVEQAGYLGAWVGMVTPVRCRPGRRRRGPRRLRRPARAGRRRR